MKEWVDQLRFLEQSRGTYSQSCQDRVLDHVFSHTKTVNPQPYCVEFGFNSDSLTTGSGSNVAKLVLERGWKSLLLDGSRENRSINLYKHFLTSQNICDVFASYRVPREPEYISIDVDSTDLWLFEALLSTYRALLYSVEYNANFPLHCAITKVNNPAETWKGDACYGASLKALTMVAQAHGYSLLWVVPGLDAFFIRNDLIDDGTELITFPYRRWKFCTGLPEHLRASHPEQINSFLDYEVYLESGGDTLAGRRKAARVCRRLLLGNSMQQFYRKFRRFLNHGHNN